MALRQVGIFSHLYVEEVDAVAALGHLVNLSAGEEMKEEAAFVVCLRGEAEASACAFLSEQWDHTCSTFMWGSHGIHYPDVKT